MNDELTKRYEVACDQLCWRCNTADMSFQSTDELAPLEGFIGQDRAIRAIEFGLGVTKPGYNLFVTGLSGTGKASAIQRHLQEVIDERQARGVRYSVHDWCYVHNFLDPDRPTALRLLPGQGRNLRRRLEELLRTLLEEMPKLFAGEQYAAERRRIEEEGRAHHGRLTQDLDKELAAASFGLEVSPTGFHLFPLDPTGQPVSREDYARLSDVQRHTIDEEHRRLIARVQEAMEQIRSLERTTGQRVQELDHELARAKLADIFQQPIADLRDVPGGPAYLESLKEYTLNNLPPFLAGSGQRSPSFGQGPDLPSGTQRNPFLPFEVNVLVHNDGREPAPVIIEPNPTWGNLFGRIERRALLGTYFSDHTMLKAGSIHRANGGYLVLSAREMLTNPGVWEGLKRAIRDREICLEDPGVQLGLVPPQGLRPEPIAWDAKVIVTGDDRTYRLLTVNDHEDFWEMFKVKAEFDSEIDLTQEHVSNYCAFISSACRAEGLLPLDPGGVARVVEYSARLVADQARLSTRFGLIKDLLIEADYWARRDGTQVASGEHVKRALEARIHRLNLLEDKIRRFIAEGTIMVDVTGKVVGQVNGLSVHDLGDFTFGRPSRITAKTFVGRRGVINIEREAQLSGRIHDKGVLILSGYLGSMYAQSRPLSLSASLSFEQSYEGVDGDSASSAELYAILSSLADLPITQRVAVTGSVNQKGEIQPIGGVNQKVEGFFDVCRVQGLTGDQGVMIPHQNVRNLMLRDDVFDAIREGRFHILAVKTIDDGIGILTGVPAGARGDDGRYPEGTVNHLVDRRLGELADSMRGFREMLSEAAS